MINKTEYDTILALARKEITKSKAKEYVKASKKRKGEILDNFCELTGMCRDNARKNFKKAYYDSFKKNKIRKKKPKKYSFRSRQILSNA